MRAGPGSAEKVGGWTCPRKVASFYNIGKKPTHFERGLPEYKNLSWPQKNKKKKKLKKNKKNKISQKKPNRPHDTYVHVAERKGTPTKCWTKVEGAKQGDENLSGARESRGIVFPEKAITRGNGIKKKRRAEGRQPKAAAGKGRYLIEGVSKPIPHRDGVGKGGKIDEFP